MDEIITTGDYTLQLGEEETLLIHLFVVEVDKDVFVAVVLCPGKSPRTSAVNMNKPGDALRYALYKHFPALTPPIGNKREQIEEIVASFFPG